MSDSKVNEEGGQGMPMTMEESHQLVDAEVQVEPEAPSSKDALTRVETGKADPPSEDEIVKPEKADLIAEDENVKPGKAEPPVEVNSQKPVKAQPPIDDKSVNPGNVKASAEDDIEQPVLAELVVEDKSLNAGKEELPTEDNSVKPGKVEVPAEENRVEPGGVLGSIPQQDAQNTLHSAPVELDAQISNKIEGEETSNAKTNADKFPQSNTDIKNDDNSCQNNVDAAETAAEVMPEAREVVDSKPCDNMDIILSSHNEPTPLQTVPADTKSEIKNELQVANKNNEKLAVELAVNGNSNSKQISFLNADHCYDGNESGTDEEQSAFMKELENFFRERSMEFKPPKFYGEGLNCLKLWRSVIRLGGYDKVTSCKLWRQVGESFKPPKTCTTVSWTFRGFYEKALLDYERHKINGGELDMPIAAASHPEPVNIENQVASASGRARRDAAARAMQGWHSQRLLGNGEVSDPIIKDRNYASMQKREKQLKSINLLKRKKPSYMDNAVKAARSKPSKPQLDTAVVDVGPPADWVKINVQKTKDCFEVYALVPGLLREEVHVQSDPAGRLVISGEPENPDNPWGVTPFKKVVSLPSRIDPHQTSAVVTLHGQLFVRAPFEQAE
ncbi:PREDICTED: AT-rich interactive domain-containing protein 3-like isoform X2 [Lupinus angustifolius]|uniref:AT-rich interactive domain-containing protein 3-like isoform X2 n=1 Tax=Lupinus angustifolius TaxID=3871 RepID=UPI00092F4154|nr:PREDICTED: AT-rich interactive domain-containing protein 3-like isoform X2 [Lupinus angustifolius]